MKKSQKTSVRVSTAKTASNASAKKPAKKAVKPASKPVPATKAKPVPATSKPAKPDTGNLKGKGSTNAQKEARATVSALNANKAEREQAAKQSEQAAIWRKDADALQSAEKGLTQARNWIGNTLDTLWNSLSEDGGKNDELLSTFTALETLANSLEDARAIRLESLQALLRGNPAQASAPVPATKPATKASLTASFQANKGNGKATPNAPVKAEKAQVIDEKPEKPTPKTDKLDKLPKKERAQLETLAQGYVKKIKGKLSEARFVDFVKACKYDFPMNPSHPHKDAVTQLYRNLVMLPQQQ